MGQTLRKAFAKSGSRMRPLSRNCLDPLWWAWAPKQDKNGKCNCPREGVLAAVFDPLGILPKAFLKDSTSQPVWLCFNEEFPSKNNSISILTSFYLLSHGCQNSIRARKKRVKAHSYTQRMEFTLYSDKALSVLLPDKPRSIYSGWSSGDAIAFVTALPAAALWKLPRLVLFVEHVHQFQSNTIKISFNKSDLLVLTGKTKSNCWGTSAV